MDNHLNYIVTEYAATKSLRLLSRHCFLLHQFELGEARLSINLSPEHLIYGGLMQDLSSFLDKNTQSSTKSSFYLDLSFNPNLNPSFTLSLSLTLVLTLLQSFKYILLTNTDSNTSIDTNANTNVDTNINTNSNNDCSHKYIKYINHSFFDYYSLYSFQRRTNTVCL